MHHSVSESFLFNKGLGGAWPRQVGSSTHLSHDEILLVNVILHPFGQLEEEVVSLLLFINLLEHSCSSTRSWSPPQMLYAITGEADHSKSEHKHQEDEAAHRVADAAEEEECLHKEDDAHSNLVLRGRCVQEEILQMKMGDINVFTTPT